MMATKSTVAQIIEHQRKREHRIAMHFDSLAVAAGIAFCIIFALAVG